MFKLTKEQIEAYDELSQITHGYYHIQAHPGSGKTSWITYGIVKKLIRFEHTNPMGILYLALNKRVQQDQIKKFEAEPFGYNVKCMTVASWMLAVAKKVIFSKYERIDIKTGDDFEREIYKIPRLEEWLRKLKLFFFIL